MQTAFPYISLRSNKDRIIAFVDSHLINYPTPINLNYMWSFGSAAGICLIVQIVTGILLSMHYIPETEFAFLSVEHIMRDVEGGWLIRYIHANGASFFFMVVYLHIFRGIFYGSYIRPRGYLWESGVVIFLLMMATAFIGYVLPWGQMSLWGATVITNLFSAIPLVGDNIVTWIWGGFSVANPTLQRFFGLHFVLPFVIAAVVLLHLALLHKTGSNNPIGADKNVPTTSFYTKFYVKDLLSFFILICMISLFVYEYPNYLGHTDNYTPANPLVTPAHIVPEWYFLPFYAILRSIPFKLGGVIAMLGAILFWLIIPHINSSLTRTSVFKYVYAIAFALLLADFALLGWIGQKSIESPYIEIGMAATAYYFFFFGIVIPFLGYLEAFAVKHFTAYHDNHKALKAANEAIVKEKIKAMGPEFRRICPETYPFTDAEIEYFENQEKELTKNMSRFEKFIRKFRQITVRLWYYL
jgi:ubiquinol-cytochrome c reductase cytochrome b subunit